MKKLFVTATFGAVFLGLAGCDANDGDTAAQNEMSAEDDTMESTPDQAGTISSAGNATASGSFPEGARIVEENGVTYRVDAGGARVRLGENDSRIVVEDDVRYRVDPGGSRVRIGEDGVVIDVDTPDVDVGVNNNGNLDVDVTDRDRDRDPR